MRRTRATTISLVLTLMVLGWLGPAVTQAAPAAAFGGGAITGTLVAVPQSTLPATMLIQVGDRTISVVVTTDTQVEDSAGNPLSLTLLADGDNLRITTTSNRQGSRGRGQSTAVDASLVQDLSQPATPQPVSPTSLTVTGTLAAVFPNGLCLQNATVISTAISPAAVTLSPCPSGELPVYLASGAVIENAGGTAVALTALLVNDSLQATGTVTSGQFTATSVEDLTQAPAPVPTPVSGSTTISGTLVAAPQSTLPATLLLQVGDRTISVVVSPTTTVEDSLGNPLSPTLLADGDNLRVTFTTNRYGSHRRGESSSIDASLVQDLSQPVTPVQPISTTSLSVTGTLAAEFPSGLCLQNATVTSATISPAAATLSPCPGGDLPVYLASGVVIENAGGTAIALASLLVNDSLQATGTMMTGQFSAVTVQDLSEGAAPAPTTAQLMVTGTLAAEFPNGLCLQNTAVISATISPAAATLSPCPGGELAVYLASGAVIENAGGTAIALATLQVNDSLQATGTVTSGQFSATSVQDLTQSVGAGSSNPTTITNPTTLTTLVGTIQTCHLFGRNPYFTIKVNRGALRGVLTIYVQNGTQILGNRSHRAKLKSLHAGQVVTVQGMYNRRNHRWSATQRVSIHG